MTDSTTTYTREQILEGLVLRVDKPLGWTSFQAVNAIKWAIRRGYAIPKIKIGHAGTLDPLASGLLLICTGKATKKIPGLQLGEKTYTGTIHMGATRPSYDGETEIDAVYDYAGLTAEDYARAARAFTGPIMQRPPVFSAIRKDGRRLYELARKGQEVEVDARPVVIEEFTLTGTEGPEVHFRVRCTKGTYIRSLAHDFGKYLGSGAYLSSLRRIQIGDYNVDNAGTPEEYKSLFSNPDPENYSK